MVYVISNFLRFPHTHPCGCCRGPPDDRRQMPSGQPPGSSNSDESVTIFSKVSLAVALIIESALPDFSLFEFAKIQLVFYLCKSYLVFVCKSTSAGCNLFA